MDGANRWRDGYKPGWLAKGSVFVAAGVYFLAMYFDSRRGADLAQGAFLQIFVPLFYVAPAWVVGLVAWAVGRRSRRWGDVAFALVMVVECGALVVMMVRGGR